MRSATLKDRLADARLETKAEKREVGASEVRGQKEETTSLAEAQRAQRERPVGFRIKTICSLFLCAFAGSSEYAAADDRA